MPQVLDAFILPACPNVASQEDAVGVCFPSSSVFFHLKVDAPAQDLVAVLAKLMILHMVAIPNCSSPAASPSSFPSLPSLGCPRVCTGPWPFTLWTTLSLDCSFLAEQQSVLRSAVNLIEWHKGFSAPYG